MEDLDSLISGLESKAKSRPYKGAGVVGDAIIGVGKGALQVPKILTGLADIVPGLGGFDRPVDKATDYLGEVTGFQPSLLAEQTKYSPKLEAQQQESTELWDNPDADGLDIANNYLQNPALIANLGAESLVPTVAGGLAGLGAKALGVTSRALAAGLGEGATIAGSTMSDIDESVDPQRAALTSVGTGAIGTAIGIAGGKLANKLNVFNPDELASKLIAQNIPVEIAEATAQKAAEYAKRGIVGRTATGGVLEAGEEIGQTYFETGLQNAAEGKDFHEGMSRQLVEAGLAGAAMGIGVNVPGSIMPVKPKGALERAADKAPPQTESTQTENKEPDTVGQYGLKGAGDKAQNNDFDVQAGNDLLAGNTVPDTQDSLNVQAGNDLLAGENNQQGNFNEQREESNPAATGTEQGDIRPDGDISRRNEELKSTDSLPESGESATQSGEFQQRGLPEDERSGEHDANTSLNGNIQPVTEQQRGDDRAGLGTNEEAARRTDDRVSTQQPVSNKPESDTDLLPTNQNPLTNTPIDEQQKENQATQTNQATETGTQESILIVKKAKYISNQLKAEGIKKNAANIKVIKARITEEYETELEIAQFTLPFEEFKALGGNGNATDEMIRDSYNFRREDLGITTTSSVQKAAPFINNEQSEIVNKDAQPAISLSEFSSKELDDSGYKEDYLNDSDALSEFNQEQKGKWKLDVESKAEISRLPDRIIDEYVDEFGKDQLLARMRGNKEKGIEGWQPKARRNEVVKKAKGKKSIGEKTWKQHLDSVKKATPRKLTRAEVAEERIIWGEARRKFNSSNQEKENQSNNKEAVSNESKTIPVQSDERTNNSSNEVVDGDSEKKPSVSGEIYHPAIESLAEDLTEGGGVVYTHDNEGKINGRTPSLNPSWLIDGALAVKTVKGGGELSKQPSVKVIKKAVDDYKAGKELKPAQVRILEALNEVAVTEEELANSQFTEEQEKFTRELNALVISAKGTSLEEYILKNLDAGDIATRKDILEWQEEVDYVKQEGANRGDTSTEAGTQAYSREEKGTKGDQVESPQMDLFIQTKGDVENEQKQKLQNSRATSVQRPKSTGAGGRHTAIHKQAERERANLVANVKTSEIRTGITTVKTPEDALHVIASIRKNAQEVMLALVLDKNDNVIQIIRHSTGLLGSSQVDSGILAGAVLDIPLANSVYFAHNHPSGNRSQSNADLSVSDSLGKLLRGTSVESKGMLVIGNGGQGSYYPVGSMLSHSTDITATSARRNKRVDVTERTFKRKGKLDFDQILSPAKALKAIKEIAKGRDGLMLIDNAHNPLSFIPMSIQEMAKLRTGSADSGAGLILREMHLVNARAVVGNIESETKIDGARTAINNVSAFVNATKTSRLLDFFTGTKSSEQNGGLPSSGSSFYFSRSKKTTGSTKAQIEYLLPRRVRKLIQQGKLNVVQSVSEISDKAYSFKNDEGIEGFYDADTDTLYLVADQLTSDNLNSTLNHELFHRARATDTKLESQLKALDKRLQGRFNLAGKGIGSKAEIDAYNRVMDANTPAKDQLEEFQAYLITIYNTNPKSLSETVRKWIADLIATIRATLIRNGVVPKNITSADLNALARYGSKVDKQHNKVDKVFGALASSDKYERFYSQLKRGIQRSPDRLFNSGKQVKQWLQSNAPKLGVKADELYWTGIIDWLDTQDKISKADVIDFLDANGIQVEKVILGKSIPYQKEYEAAKRAVIEAVKNDVSKSERIRLIRERDSFEDKLNEHIDNNPDIDFESDLYEGKYNTDAFTLPNGKDYQELILTIPTIEKFKETDSIHFGGVGEGKQIAWLRHNTRTDENGNDTLFLEEVQSQRLTEGRRKGFKGADYMPDYKKLNDEVKRLTEEIQMFTGSMSNNPEWDGLRKRKNHAIQKRNDFKKEHDIARYASGETKQKGVPPAPFVTDSNNKATNAYISLVLKQAISHAIDNGQSSVSWTTGDQQADRYDLSKQVEEINYSETDNDKFDVTVRLKTGETAHDKAQIWTQEQVEENLGKDIAEKMVKGEGEVDTNFPKIKSLSSLDIKVGGAWAQAMYGDESGLNAKGQPSLILQAARQIAKKMGGKVGTVDIIVQRGKPTTYKDFDAWQNAPSQSRLTQPALIITDKMRANILGEGMPLFSRIGAPISDKFKQWFGKSKMKAKGKPIKFYHGTHADFTVFDKDKLKSSTLHTTAELGHFFTKDKAEAQAYGSNVNEVYLKLENPYVVTSELLDKRMGNDVAKFAEKLQARGFDGLYIKDVGYAVAFDSNQVKLTSNESPTNNSDIRYSYAGKNAKTADNSALAKAVKMEQDGVDNETIRKETGWFLGMDDKWRFEIDDSNIKVDIDLIDNIPEVTTIGALPRLSKILKNSGLFKAYPFLNNVWVGTTKKSKGSAEHLDKDRYLINIDSSLGNEEKRGALLHEVQHVIQMAEGFAMGGNPAMFELSKKDIARQKIASLLKETLEVEGIEEALKQMSDEIIERSTLDINDNTYTSSEFEAAIYFKNSNDPKAEIEKFVQQSSEPKADPFKLYQSLAGEIEARDTQARKDLTPDQRKKTKPYESQGISKKDAIVRYGNGVAHSEPNDPDIRLSKSDNAEQNSADNDATKEFKRKAGLGKKKTLPDTVKDILNRGLAANKQAIKDYWDEVKAPLEQGIFDKHLGIRLAEREVRGEMIHSLSGYVGARLSTGSSSTMSAVLQHGSPEWKDGVISKKEGSKGFAEILTPVKDDLENFAAWKVAVRANRLFSEGKENNFSRAEIDAGLALEQDSYQKVSDDIATLNTDILTLAEDAGIVDPKSRKLFENSDYIPFYRLVEDRPMGVKGKRGLSHQSSGIKMLKGSESPMSDPLGNMMQNWAHLIDASMKNSALDKTLNNLEGSRFVEKRPNSDFKQAIIPKSQIKKLMLEAGLPKEVVDSMPAELTEGMAKMWSMVTPSDPDIVRVMRSGKAEFYKVNDSMLLTSLTSLNQEQLGGIFRPMRYMKRLLTASVTATPAFMARNFIRDSAHSWTIAEEKGFKLGVDSIHGAVKSFREEGGYVDMMFAGASFQGGYGNYNQPDAARKSMDSALRKKGITNVQGFKDSVIDTPKKWWEMYRSIGDAIENANREAILENSKQAGDEKAKYLFESKDIMDFSMGGSFTIVRALSDMLPFFSARLTGIYRLTKAGKTKEATQMMMAKGASIAMASLALLAMNLDNDDYEGLEDWDKDAYWHIFVGDQHFRVPKPFEIGLIFGTIPERSARALIGKDTLGEFASRMGHGVTDTLAFNPVPQMFKPFVEVYANRNMFTQRPIEGMADEGKLPSARYNAYTSDTMKSLSSALPESLGASPKRLEHLMGGYLGSMGMYILGASDVLVRGMIDAPPKPSMRIDRLPLVKAFYQEKPAMHTKYGTDFYEMLSDVNTIYRTINAYKKEGRINEAMELRKDNADKLRQRRALLNTNKNVARIRRRINLIMRSDLTPAAKKNKIDNLINMTNSKVRDVVLRTDEYFK